MNQRTNSKRDHYVYHFEYEYLASFSSLVKEGRSFKTHYLESRRTSRHPDVITHYYLQPCKGFFVRIWVNIQQETIRELCEPEAPRFPTQSYLRSNLTYRKMEF